MVLGEYTHRTETSGITLITCLSGQTQRRQRPIPPAFTCSYLWLVLDLPFSTAIFSHTPYQWFHRADTGFRKVWVLVLPIKTVYTCEYIQKEAALGI